ncbi:MAG: hypothetical protein ACRD0G_17375, partial [Acidimicrobiales bacterium]
MNPRRGVTRLRLHHRVRPAAFGPLGLDAELLRWGALAGAAALLVSSTGDVFVALALLGVAAWSLPAALAAALAATATVARWGMTDLGDIAGAQSV